MFLFFFLFVILLSKLIHLKHIMNPLFRIRHHFSLLIWYFVMQCGKNEHRLYVIMIIHEVYLVHEEKQCEACITILL